MTEFDKIYLAWRAGASERRHIVGLLQRLPEGGYVFQYLPEAGKLSEEKGFIPYTEFPDLNKQYSDNVVEIFAQRLMRTDRTDSEQFFRFWEVDPPLMQDKFYLLGKTQGLVSTDNFEFLAEYHFENGIHFLTDVAGLTHLQLPKDSVRPGDMLSFRLEHTNEYDRLAVALSKDDLSVGYIKKVHNKIFHESGSERLQIKVKAVEQNGTIRKIFATVSSN